jgi:hypothetical protein
MKFPVSTFFSAILLFPIFFSSTTRADHRTFYDAYFEGTRMNESKTFTGLLEPRFGVRFDTTPLEVYAVVRSGGDSRTFLERDGIYNDNYTFTGVGVDLPIVTKGFRLSARAGRSFDLSQKIHLAGFDARLGAQTFHEFSMPLKHLSSEIYTEAFYVKRYDNILALAQLRLFHRTFSKQLDAGRIELGPLFTAAGGADTSAIEYNRFFEAQAGMRLRFNGPVSVGLSPYVARGWRWQTGTITPAYQDFRILLFAQTGS